MPRKAKKVPGNSAFSIFDLHGTFLALFLALLVPILSNLGPPWRNLGHILPYLAAQKVQGQVPGWCLFDFPSFLAPEDKQTQFQKKTRPKQQATSQPSGRPTPKAGNAENKTAKRAQGQKNRAPKKNTATAAGNQPASQQFGKPALKAGATEIRPFLNEPTRPLRTWLASQPEPMPELSDH